MRPSRLTCVLFLAGLTAPMALAQAQPASKPAEATPPATTPAAAPKGADDKLPSGKDVLLRFLEKTGGRAAYEKHTARVVTGTMEMAAMGIKAPYTLTQAAPDKFRMTIDIPGMGKFDQGGDGATVWGVDPMNGPRVLPPAEAEQVVRGMVFNAELEPEKMWKTMETAGLEDVNAKATYKVVLTPPTGTATTNYYEVESGLLVKSVQIVKSPMGDVPTESLISEYKDFDGIKVATLNVQQLGPMLQKMTIDKVEHPANVEGDVLALPAEIKALMDKKAAAPAGDKGDAKPAPAPAPAPTPAPEAKPAPKGG